jgi:hypothetical protein
MDFSRLDRMTHLIELRSPDDVDDAVRAWLRRAFAANS